MTVKLRKERCPYKIIEIEVPNGVFKEEIHDYQDSTSYFKYYYISKKGDKKECKIKYV